MDEAHGQGDGSRPLRRNVLLGALGAVGAALVTGAVALLRVQPPDLREDSTPGSPNSPDPVIPPEPAIPERHLPEFTRLPRPESAGTVVERDLPENAELYLLIRNPVGGEFPPKDVPPERWIPITTGHGMWSSHQIAAIGWLTTEEASALSESGEFNAPHLVSEDVITNLQSEFRTGLPITVGVTRQDAAATHWQRQFNDLSHVDVFVVEWSFPVGGIGSYPAFGQVLIEASNETLPEVLQEIARNSQVSSINWGGIVMHFYCPPCGQG